MRLVKLKDCCTIKPPKAEAKKRLSGNDLVSFVPMNNLGINTPHLILEEDRQLSDVSGSYTYFAENDVLLAKITPCFENGKLGIARGLTNGIGFGSSEFIVFRTNEELLPEYLYYYLLRPIFREQGQAVMTGAVGHKRIPKDFIENLEIPLPSIEEQKLIISMLEMSFAEIEKAQKTSEKNLKNAQELFDSYLNQVFTKNEGDWSAITLGEVCKFENGDRGKNYPSRAKFVESGIAFINAGHIDNGVIDFSSMNYITSENYELLSRGKVQTNDILFCLRGSLGKFAKVADGVSGAIASSLVIIRPNDNLSIEFLMHYLRSGLCKKMIEKHKGGAAQPNLGAKDLAKFLISVPLKPEQLEMANRLDALMIETANLKAIYARKTLYLNELKESILNKAFSGELINRKGAAA